MVGSCTVSPLEFVEPDLSSLPAPRPMSPEATPNDKRDSLSEKNRADSAIFTGTKSFLVFKEEKKEGKEE
ncbi:hypothetical protein MAR_037746 [Mya arenaria]|uniref:Uncharacterized protein n=1 Tax=Mya arenaria TaxID=6604 RepID=A0ABY7FR78_MYAAR|nr:hypothetical protein MAR_037746 [Mya arenaria]